MDAGLGLVDDLAKAIKCRVRLDPAMFVGRPRMMVFEPSQLVIHIVRVATLYAGLSPAKPFPVLILTEPGVFPQEKICLRFVRRAENVRFIDEAFLKKLVGPRVDSVDAAILVIGNPNQEAFVKSPVTAKLLTGLTEMDGNFVKQELRVRVAAAYRGPFDLEALEEGLHVVGGKLWIEDEVKIDALAGFS